MKLDIHEKLSVGLIVLTFLLSLGATLSLGAGYMGSDVYYHLEVAMEWARGENAFLSSFVLSRAHTPYPPLFHWLFVIPIWLGFEGTFVKFLQVFFYTGTVALTIWFVRKYLGSKASFYSGLILLSSVPFTDCIMQVRPQSLTMLLLPLILYFYIERKSLGFVTTFLVTVYSWSIAPLFFIYSLVLARLKDRKWMKNTVVIISLVLVLGAVTYYYSDLSLMFGRWGGHWDSLQERLLWEQPLTMFFTYLGTSWMGIPILAYSIFKWKEQPKYIKTICMVLASSLILFPLWTDRWFQVSSILLSVLTSKWLSERKGFWYGVVLTYIVLLFGFWQIYYWSATFTGAWYSAGYNAWFYCE